MVAFARIVSKRSTCEGIYQLRHFFDLTKLDHGCFPGLALKTAAFWAHGTFWMFPHMLAPPTGMYFYHNEFSLLVRRIPFTRFRRIHLGVQRCPKSCLRIKVAAFCVKGCQPCRSICLGQVTARFHRLAVRGVRRTGVTTTLQRIFRHALPLLGYRPVRGAER